MTKLSLLKHLGPGKVRQSGPLGKMLELSIANRLKKIDYVHLVDPFRFRYEKDNAWRCEFWGKIVRSAILSWCGNPDAELLAIIKGTVADMLSTQTEDGCISSYPYEKQTDGWDIWGRKYVLLALCRYYNFIEQDKRIAQACGRVLEHLMTQVGPDAKDILDTGCHEGLASSSILDAVVETWRITGEKKFLDYARWIANRGCSKKHNIFQAVRAGVPPCELGNGKAYEMMSCFQGLAELYMEVQEPEYLDAVLEFYKAVRDREIIVTGVGGSKDKYGEFWNDTAFRQFEKDCGSFGETCVTTTWLHYCECVLRLTGDGTVADEMEKSLYNGILGAVNTDGASWIHVNPTPLAGISCKIPSFDQIGYCFKTPFDGHDCCLAQGPEALAMSAYAAAYVKSGVLYINFYENADIDFKTPTGQTGKIKISGGFPSAWNIHLNLRLDREEKFGIALRIPGWNAYGYEVFLNDEAVREEKKRYFVLEKKWKRVDDFVIRLGGGESGEGVTAENGIEYENIKCGPLVMVQDRRFTTVGTKLRDVDFDSADIPEGCLCSVMNRHGERLIDYASAGKPFGKENTICIWMKC